MTTINKEEGGMYTIQWGAELTATAGVISATVVEITVAVIAGVIEEGADEIVAP